SAATVAARATRAHGAASAYGQSTAMPSAPVSPTLTGTALSTPAAEDGTSIVALSDSSVQIGSSTAMLSPTFTNSSMTGTESKSPMSGTFTSTRLMAISLQHHAAEIRQQLRQIHVEAGGQRTVDHSVVRGQRHR